jgi:hypothetical protein
MKILAAVLFTTIFLSVSAQSTLVPKKDAFEKKWITNKEYKMKWLGLRDTSKIEIAEVQTKFLKQNEKLTVITNIKMKHSTEPWADTTVSNVSTLKPIYHSSYNKQRDMVINFGPTVTGTYQDKIKNEKSLIYDKPISEYFDSNIYPVLIGWLPLKDGYTRNIAVYDYVPGNEKSVREVSVTEVKSDKLKTKAGLRDVWRVTIVDMQSNYIFYFDKKDRTLWRQEINAGGRKMLLLREE